MGKRKQNFPRQLIEPPTSREPSYDVNESTADGDDDYHELQVAHPMIMLGTESEKRIINNEIVRDATRSRQVVTTAQQIHNDVVPPQPSNNDVVPPQPSNNDVVPPQPSNNDVVPPQPSNNDVVPPQPSNNDVVPPQPSNNDVVPPQPSNNDVVPPQPSNNDRMICGHTIVDHSHDTSSSDDHSSDDDDDDDEDLDYFNNKITSVSEQTRNIAAEQSKERRTKKKTMNLRELVSTKSRSEEIQEKREMVQLQKLHRYRCEFSDCSKEYKSKYDLREHQLRSHNRVSRIKCELCKNKRGTYFATETEYEQHQLFIHIKPFACRICNARYASSGGLKRHMHMLHLTEKPHQCTVEGCGMAFRTLGGLEYHVRDCAERLKRRKHLCPQCPKRYSNRQYLINHLKSHHGGGKKVSMF